MNDDEPHKWVLQIGWKWSMLWLGGYSVIKKVVIKVKKISYGYTGRLKISRYSPKTSSPPYFRKRPKIFWTSIFIDSPPCFWKFSTDLVKIGENRRKSPTCLVTCYGRTEVAQNRLKIDFWTEKKSIFSDFFFSGGRRPAEKNVDETSSPPCFRAPPRVFENFPPTWWKSAKIPHLPRDMLWSNWSCSKSAENRFLDGKKIDFFRLFFLGRTSTGGKWLLTSWLLTSWLLTS